MTVGLGPDSDTGAAQSFTVYDGPSPNGGNVDFVADLQGYYAPATSSSGGTYMPLSPARIYDSRSGSGHPGAGTTLTNGGSDNVTVTGVGGVPGTATAVVLNVAITNPSASSFIYAYPAGSAPSTPVANQAFVDGETLSSQVIAGVGSQGAVTVANHAGNVDIIVDVDGYFTPAGASGSLLTILGSPTRLLDTRPGGVTGGNSATAAVSGAGATAGVLSIADIYTDSSGGNFLTVYPAGASAPTAANVNYAHGDTYDVVENSAYSITAGGEVSILNGPASAGIANIVVDESGYFATSTTTTSGPPTFVSSAGTASSSSSASAPPGGAIILNYNEPVTCASVTTADYAAQSPSGTADAPSTAECTSSGSNSGPPTE
ncbi:MAG: hypothetical protein ACYDD6_08900, partial [Acidimicrobiales bacterium]